MKVLVIGRGKVGRALASALQKADVDATLRPSRRAPTQLSGAAHVLLLAVSDASISAVATRWAKHVDKQTVVMHVSGARGPEELLACARAGAAIAALHPLVSFAAARQSPTLRGATFTFHGEKRAATKARALCRALGVHMLVHPIVGPAYHAAAAAVANGSAALANLGVQILIGLGVPKREAERALASLLISVGENVRAIGVPAALTGPIVRGDVDTVRAHLRSLARIAPKLTQDYLLVSRVILTCAEHAGIEPRTSQELRALFTSGSTPPPRNPRLPPLRGTKSSSSNASKTRRSRRSTTRSAKSSPTRTR
jgi:predicted short-subunit dehydrogenase-like oxidoreductase (DUF2520 family)